MIIYIVQALDIQPWKTECKGWHNNYWFKIYTPLSLVPIAGRGRKRCDVMDTSVSSDQPPWRATSCSLILTAERNCRSFGSNNMHGFLLVHSGPFLGQRKKRNPGFLRILQKEPWNFRFLNVVAGCSPEHGKSNFPRWSVLDPHVAAASRSTLVHFVCV